MARILPSPTRQALGSQYQTVLLYWFGCLGRNKKEEENSGDSQIETSPTAKEKTK
jgi:hypothetical protein